MQSEYKGLTSTEAKKRLEKYGPNELRKEKKESLIWKFLSHFRDFLTLLLLAAAIVAGALGEIVDAVMILIIVILQVVLGFVQEYKAEKSFEALQKMVSPKAKVLRDGRFVILDTNLIVPGDVVLLEAGDKVPADGKIIEAANTAIDEAALTGESVPVAKHANEKDQGFMGTVVVSGKCKLLVEETGMNTKVGEISEMVQTVEKEITPIEKDMNKLGKDLGVGVLALCAIIFIVGILRGFEPFEMFLTSVSLAVAAIPEGLAAVVVITMAIGVQRMSKKNAIVKKMKAVETLGCANVICTDKTGTLTKNEMTVRKVLLGGEIIDVGGTGYEPVGEFSKKMGSGLEQLIDSGILCNNAYLVKEANDGWRIIGDPTEGSLIVLGEKAGKKKEKLEKKHPVVKEFPFDSERKMMSVVRKSGAKKTAYVKGAPEMILARCTKVLENGKIKKMNAGALEKVKKENNELTNKGMRTLAIAYKDMGKEKINQENSESGLVLLGIVGMIDSPREEVAEALRLCKIAGIRVIMITGDHPLTARAIATELGIGNKKYLTGEQLDQMTEKQIDEAVKDVSIYARVSPANKLMLIKALNKRGDVVAMTGDGVNDAPALKKADIGVAMGITGTEVAKESAEVVLTDDNFAAIVWAIEEGRGIYDNIRKTIAFLISGNIAEVAIIFFGVMLGLPLPLIAIQILWINLVTDGLPAIALAMDPIDPTVMDRSPRVRKRSIWAGLGLYLFEYPIIVTAVCLGTFMYMVDLGEVVLAQTMVFTMIMLFETMQSFSCRSLRRPVWKEVFANKFLLAAIVATILLQVAILYIPLLNELFHVVPLSLGQWAYMVAVALGGFAYLEVRKWMGGTKNAYA